MIITQKKYPKQSFNVDEHFIKILNNLLSGPTRLPEK